MSAVPSIASDTGEIEERPADRPPVPGVMSLDDARALLVREHSVAVGNDDPLLMAVTLHQGFVRDYQAMLADHDEAIKKILGATGEACAVAVDKVLESLKDKTVKASLDQAFALVSHQAANMEGLNLTIKRFRRLLVALTLVAVAASGLAMLILFTILR